MRVTPPYASPAPVGDGGVVRLDGQGYRKYLVIAIQGRLNGGGEGVGPNRDNDDEKNP